MQFLLFIIITPGKFDNFMRILFLAATIISSKLMNIFII